MINQTVRVYNTDKKNFGLLERFCQMKMNDLTKSSPRVVDFFFRNRIHLRPMVLPEYTTQRSIDENGDRPTNNIVTSDVPSPEQIVSQSPNVSMNNSTQYHTRSGRVTNRPLRYTK